MQAKTGCTMMDAYAVHRFSLHQQVRNEIYEGQ